MPNKTPVERASKAQLSKALSRRINVSGKETKAQLIAAARIIGVKEVN